jgi:hypothetical protein
VVLCFFHLLLLFPVTPPPQSGSWFPPHWEAVPSTPTGTSLYRISQAPHNCTERQFCCQTAHCQACSVTTTQQVVWMVACLDSVSWLKLLPVNAYHFSVHVQLLLNVAPLWVSGDSPQTTSISPCSNYTNVLSIPLPAPCLGLFTSSQTITDYTDNTHTRIHLFGILLRYFNPWKWDHYITLKPINHQHSATFQKEWIPHRSSYLHLLNIK